MLPESQQSSLPEPTQRQQQSPLTKKPTTTTTTTTTMMKKETTTKHRLSMLQSSIILSVLLVSKAPVGANAFVPGWTSMTPTSTSTLPKSTTTTTTTTTSTPTFVHRGRSRPRPAKISSDNEWGIPDSDTLEPLSATVRDELPNGGCVTLVGSGPGDPDLLTVAAYKILADPDNLVIADRLVSKEILDLIGGEIKVARKLPGCAELAQEEIYSWAHEGLKEGRHVVRLKIGDPFVFGRGGEEVLKFRYFGVEPTVIPGVSAAFSAPLLASIPVTHRGVSNQVVMCTGYGREGTSPDLIQYHKEQTIVFLMAVGRLRELSKRLINMANYPSDTPVAIVERAGCPDQRTVVGNLETIADMAEQYTVKPPSTIVVGGVVNVLLEKDDDSVETVTGLVQNFTASVF